jgi:diguanylate cyclase (GGDEF)-like protein
VLQSRSGILVNTAGAQLGSLAAVVFTLAYEAFEKRRLHRLAERERREALERLAHLARYDALTGALTRHEFLSRVEAEIKRGVPIVVIAFSLTRFSRVGEALGHEVGDLVLKQVVERTRAIVPAELARIAGDNFALMPTLEVEGLAVDALCASIHAALRASYEAAGHQVVVGCRIGVTQIEPGSGIHAETALRQAEMASSAASQMPAQPLVVFEPAMEERINATRVMELALRESLGRREIEVYFQAQVDLRTGMVVGAEALSRWHHPVLGTVPPQHFVAVAEETGLAVELGAAILERACREAVRWSAPVRAAVNVSPSQFDLDDVPELIEQALAMTGLPPNRLDIEITEGLLLGATSPTLQALERLRAKGVGVAIDDFGTGYASLGYLASLPVDKLKIDQSFTRQLGESRADTIVEMILGLAHRLSLTVVAEGIETEMQANWLRARHCQVGQGYLFHRPAPAVDFRHKLAHEQAEPPLAIAASAS